MSIHHVSLPISALNCWSRSQSQWLLRLEECGSGILNGFFPVSTSRVVGLLADSILRTHGDGNQDLVCASQALSRLTVPGPFCRILLYLDLPGCLCDQTEIPVWREQSCRGEHHMLCYIYHLVWLAYLNPQLSLSSADSSKPKRLPQLHPLFPCWVS